MAKQRIFISFDYDNDADIKVMLAGQAKLDDSPFDFIDGSIKEHLPGDWKAKAEGRIANCDQMIVLCGESTHLAKGVSDELKIAQSLKKPYFLIWGRTDKTCYKPVAALTTDKIYSWTWPLLKKLIAGER